MTKAAWTVSAGEYSDYGVCAVFSSKETADLYASRLNAAGGSRTDAYFVEEFPLDPEVPVEGMPSWTVYVHRNGDIEGSHVDSTANLPTISSYGKCPRFPNGGFVVHCFAADAEHAIKIAGEKRQEQLALEATQTGSKEP
ncbi:hypothetical protein [Acidithiobacillus sp.]|uniref:hypothetical protein n=1 Tax=Acidithiobacillus sp. TaxID=1872118 RepID=UPI00258C8987|nr:hypothetical protein [Acidithiobacillus sp.]MDD5374430.1 hypothetical protein [Acidithiobacillus sp.]